MGLLDTPPGADGWMRAYSYFLKFEANVFAGIGVVAYLLKWGVAWHWAGEPFNVGDIKFSAYWDMIIILYTSLGIYLLFASTNPARFKPLLGWSMWGANFCHGIIAFIHCFDEKQGSEKYGADTLGAKAHNYDKLFVAVPLWFGMGIGNLIFCKKIFGSFLFPWDLAKEEDSVQHLKQEEASATTLKPVVVG